MCTERKTLRICHLVLESYKLHIIPGMSPPKLPLSNGGRRLLVEAAINPSDKPKE